MTSSLGLSQWLWIAEHSRETISQHIPVSCTLHTWVTLRDWIQLDYVDFSFNPDLSFNLVQFLMYVEVCSGEYLLFVFPVLGLISVYGKSARSVSVCRLTPGELGKQINTFYSQTYIPAEETSSHTHGYQFHGSALYFTFWANYFNPRQFDKGRLDL